MTSQTSRREFLRRQAAFAGLGVAAPWALNMAAMSAASAQAAPNDYRALVCIFQAGANDCHNTVVPLDAATYKAYADIRTSIALPLADLAATELLPTNPWPDGRRMALHPALAPLKTLFDDGRLALAMNVGTMAGPITLADYNAGKGKPPKLFSHNDQQATWQSGGTDSPTGWGGRAADLMLQGNGEAGIFTAITTGGGLFVNGKDVNAYQVGTNGSTEVAKVFGSDAATAAIKRMMQRASTHDFEEAHAAVARRSIAADLKVRAAIGGGTTLVFPDTSLGNQLKIVARLIAARAELGFTSGTAPQRQVFFVTIGGWDMHNNLIADHPVRLGEVANAMKAFYDATVTLGLADKVTTFTASDFGRTLSNNGDGSDHGWGGYHFVMGNAVDGKRWCGQLPAMAVNGPDDVGGGRLLPAIAVDQYAATLASWFGVDASHMASVVPRIALYDKADLGFMKTA